jgi:Domain of unknown function (DUF222)
MPSLLQELSDSIDQLIQADSFSYSDGESMKELECQLSRLSFVASKAVANFESSGEFAQDEATDAAAWLTSQCQLPKHEARAQLRRGRVLDDMPHCAQAWSDGSIGEAQFDALERSRRNCSHVDFARVEEALLREVKDLTFAQLGRALAYWEQRMDPVGAKEAELARHERRDVAFSPGSNGMHFGRWKLSAIPGTIVSRELNRIAQGFFDDDWAKAKAELGRDPKISELCRTPGQRMADALEEMAIRSGTAPADGQRPQPLFSIVVGYEALQKEMCQTSEGQVVTPSSLVPWMTKAYFERIVFDPKNRVECSATSRFFTGATRRGIEMRDLQCQHPTCEVPFERCQADHIVPYSQGGLTIQLNGQLLCGKHNRMRNGRPPPGA